MADISGHTLGQYEILELIGQGGMANVYRGVQKSIGREVAIKVLPATFLQDSTFLERFNREVQVIARLQHPRILPVHDFGEQDGLPYIVMAYLSGGSLADRIRQADAGMPLDEVAILVEQIAEGLDFAHERGIIHRDFKPSNVLLDEKGNAYLADFGIAKVSEATAQLTGSGIIGTPGYMAPEMTQRADVNHMVDVYALGITLYQMLVGKLPYEAATPMALALAHITQPVPDARESRPDLPDAVQAVIEHAMAKDPAVRYQSAGSLAADLRAAIGGRDREYRALKETLPEPVTMPPTPPDVPTMDVSEAVAPEWDALAESQEPGMDAPATVTEAPAPRRGLPASVWIGGGLLGVALLVGVLALAGIFGGGESASAPEEEAAPVKEEVEPTDTPTPIPEEVEAAEEPTRETDPITLARDGVSRNVDWTPYTEELNGVPMALVPAGCFQMGSRDGDSDERPVHEVCFEEPFWIDVYEVTNEAFGSVGCEFDLSESDQPRNCVSWADSLAHCEARGARLPTEAEWEYAARGLDGLVYPWGNFFVADNVVYGENDPGGTAPVGSKPGGVSWVGAHDLSGNVWEWVNDWYGSYESGRQVNPQGPSSGGYRVLRGGSWYGFTLNVRAAFRLELNPSYVSDYIGFRCARSYSP